MVEDPLGAIKRQFTVHNGGFNLLFAQLPIEILDFNLHPSLTLNITFIQIRIMYMNLFKCFIGNVTVESYFRRSITGTVSNLRRSVYCGCQSYIVCYKSFRFVQVKIAVHVRVQYDVSLAFSVLGSGLVESFQRKGHRGYEMICSELALLFHETLCTYKRALICVRKTKFIIVRGNSYSSYALSAFDGPGLLSKNVRLANQGDFFEFRSSSFQFTIIIKEMRISIYRLSYLEVDITDTTKYMVNGTETIYMAYPNGLCNLTSIICLINFSSEGNYKVNLTVFDLKFVGTHNSNCEYAGIVLLDSINSNLVELKTICHYFNRIKYQSFYSKNSSSLFIIIYMYKEYGQFNVSFYISQTKCSSITINVCSFELPCEYSQNKMCSELQTLPNFQSDCIGRGENCIDENKIFAHIKVKNEECVIAQLTHDTRDLVQLKKFWQNYNWEGHLFCRLKGMKIVTNSSLRYRRHYHGVGMFTGIFFFLKANDKYLSRTRSNLIRSQRAILFFLF